MGRKEVQCWRVWRKDIPRSSSPHPKASSLNIFRKGIHRIRSAACIKIVFIQQLESSLRIERKSGEEVSLLSRAQADNMTVSKVGDGAKPVLERLPPLISDLLGKSSVTKVRLPEAAFQISLLGDQYVP